MLGKKRLFNLINYILKRCRTDQAEVLVMNYTSYLTRYANNYIHQNVGEENTGVVIRTVIGKRVGIAMTNQIFKKKIDETIENAITLTKLQPENPDFRSLPYVHKKNYKSIPSFYRSTANFSPEARARAVNSIIKLAQSSGLKAYGSFTTGTCETGIGNSLGILAYNLATDAYCNIVMMGEDSSGYAEISARDVQDFDVEKFARIAIDKAQKSQRPIALPPGRYTVILEPLAVAEMLNFLGWLGFGAKLYQEGRSFLKGKLGTKIVDERITLLDDAYDKRGFAFPFDFEGVPKKRLKLIENGIAREIAYDSYTAYKEGKESTGHALVQPNYAGPIPLNMVMKAGQTSLKDMIATTQKGILITRFHYTNTVEPMKTVITGMTRDGTFLIENGAIVNGVKNLRFTQSIVEALNNLVAISNKTVLIGSGIGYQGRFVTGSIVPALKIDNFNFTGVTEF